MQGPYFDDCNNEGPHGFISAFRFLLGFSSAQLAAVLSAFFGRPEIPRHPRARAPPAGGHRNLAIAGSPGILSRMPDEPEAPPADGMSGGESNPIVAVGGITLPAMRLSGMLTVGDIRDAVQELRDSCLEETDTPAGRVFLGA